MTGDQEIELPELPEFLEAVPMFPLPGVVLFPKAVLPLHIFEPRYRAMTSDALDRDGLLVMGNVVPERAEDDVPAVHEVAGVGKIVEHQLLDDGRYNLLVIGLRRVRITDEYEPAPYRRADVQVLPEGHVMEIDLDAERAKIGAVLERPPLAELALGRQLRQLLDGPHATGEIAGLIAYELLDDPAEKQAILETDDAKQRVARTANAFARRFPDPADAQLRAERKLFD